MSSRAIEQSSAVDLDQTKGQTSTSGAAARDLARIGYRTVRIVLIIEFYEGRRGTVVDPESKKSGLAQRFQPHRRNMSMVGRAQIGLSLWTEGSDGKPVAFHEEADVRPENADYVRGCQAIMKLAGRWQRGYGHAASGIATCDGARYPQRADRKTSASSR